MHLRASGSGRRGIGLTVAFIAALCAQHASAALPPTINPAAEVAIPQIDGPEVVINLRAVGAISGTAPLILETEPLQILVDDEPVDAFSVRPFNNNGPGFTCIIISNGGYIPDPEVPETITLDLAVRSLSTPTPTVGRVILLNNPGAPIVGEGQEDQCNDPNTPPVANAGPDQTVFANQSIVLNGTASSDVDVGTVLSYQWTGQAIDALSGPTVTVPPLPPGTYQFVLTVTDDSGDPATNSSEDAVTVTVLANAPPTVDAGEDQSLTDTDGLPGELVTLTGIATDPDGGELEFQWVFNDEIIGTGATLQTNLPDGINEVLLVVTDEAGESASDTVIITIAPPDEPVANAGEDQTIADSDGQPGESVTLDGSASVATGGIASYIWQNAQEEQIATGPTPTVTLPDGENVITLIVANNAGLTATDTVTITIAPPPQTPIANAGADQTIADSDREPGEFVTLDGTASSDPNGDELTYEWTLLADEPVVLGNAPTLSVRLPDGENTVSLRVEDPDGNFATDTIVITVGAPVQRASLAELPNLTPNQRAMAQALDRICLELDALSQEQAPLSDDQRVLLDRCNALLFDNTPENQVRALEELGADDFAAARTQTLLFSNTLHASVMDRLMALRGGAKGLSLAGLNIVVDGKLVPLAQLQEMAKSLLGGGASADTDAEGGLLSDKLGLWLRGNYSFGEKDESPTAPRFEADQWALMGGIDYRTTPNSVVGVSFAYGKSDIEFSPKGEGSLDTTSWAASLYGSVYAAKNFYLDGVLNFANSDYDARRNITYVDGSGLVDVDADGSTDGLTVSGGISAGYDFLLGKLTLSPTLGVFYIDATIDGFTESGATGLNLIYDEQNFTSLTGNLGLRATYAWNTSWGVLLPHVRMDYVREFEDEVDVFGVRFAADPNAQSTPPILVQTDNPDRSYWRLAGGLSAQFAHGISGYVEYQRLESFEFITFQDISVGLRFQRSF